MLIDRSRIITNQKIRPTKYQLALEMRRVPTPAERLLWQRLRRGGLGGLHFRQQQVIDGFIVDFYCHAAGVVLELDGGVHKTRRDYDAERDRLIAARGLLVIRIKNEEVERDINNVLQRIERICRGRVRKINLTPGPFPKQTCARLSHKIWHQAREREW